MPAPSKGSVAPEALRILPNARVTRSLDADVRAKVAFRRVGDQWAGGFLAHDTKVTEVGEIAFTPHPIMSPQMLGTKVKRGPRSERIQMAGDEARLNTIAIRRGESDLSAGSFEVREVGGEMIVHRGTVREVIANTERGMEQQWEFDSKPAGSGDVTVQVAVAGAGFVESRGAGLVFADTKGVGFTYGHATWVDGNGVRTPVETVWNGQAIEMRVPRALIETSAYPASLDPLTVPSPHPLSSTYVPATAAIGTTNIVVWESYTNGFPNLRFSFTNDSDGQVNIGVYNKTVSTVTYQQDPYVAPAGASDYVVVWSDKRSGRNNIRMARVNATTGAVSNDIAVAASGSTDQYRPSVACTSATACFVAWNEFGAISTINGALVNPSAGTAGAVQAVASAPSFDEYAAQVATSGSAYLVAWEAQVNATDYLIKARRVDSAGTPLTAPANVTSGPLQYTPSAAFDGSNYIVGFTTETGGDSDAAAQRITTAGANTGSVLTLATGATAQGGPRFARDGATALLATYADGTDIVARSITTATGTTLGTPFNIASAADTQTLPSVTKGSGNYYYIAYSDKQTGTFAATGVRATTSQLIAPAVVLADGPRAATA
ncbi:MAG: hypothetical protein IPG50_29790 [Myxococcales bacterium]|nr:hypothetical protein [Myxococcales bacterium]